jgi:FtsH-binding integral membrane protein
LDLELKIVEMVVVVLVLVLVLAMAMAMAMAIVGDLRQNIFWVWFIWGWTVAVVVWVSSRPPKLSPLTAREN